MEEGRIMQKYWWLYKRERDHWGDQDAYRKIILKFILGKW
jgi:hypothetical protein